MVRTLIAACLMLATAVVQAATLEAHIDRQRAEMGDILTFTLTLKGVEVTDQVPGPDFSVLEKDFRILGQQRNTQLMMHNGEISKFEQWQLQLTPRRTGTLTLPAFEIAGSASKPVTLTVLPAPAQLQKTPAFFLQNGVDTATPYVQQQVRYRVRLYYRGELINGAVAPPALPDAQIIRLNEQSVFRKQVNGALYTVFEWHYALFPQRSGTLTLPPQGFTGQLYLNQKLIQVSGKTDPISLTVRPIPATWPDSHPWLPSARVTLQANWDGPEAPKAGDSLTLTLILSAEGVRGEQLPELKLPPVKGVRIYADPPRADTRRGDQGLTGIKTYRWTLLLTQPGPIPLPQLRIPWWDTVHDRLRWVSTEKREVNVRPGDTRQPDAVTPRQGGGHETGQDTPLWPWQLATGAFALLSLLLGWLLWRHRRGVIRNKSSSPPPRQTFRKKGAPALCQLSPGAFYQRLIREPELKKGLDDNHLRELEAALFLHGDTTRAEAAKARICQHLSQTPSKKFDTKTDSKLKSVYP